MERIERVIPVVKAVYVQETRTKGGTEGGEEEGEGEAK